MSYFVETSVIIDFLRGKKKAVVLLDTIEGDIVSSFVCLAELYEGVYRSPNRTKHEELINTYFKSLHTIYGLDERIAQKFGEIRANLKQKGKIIEDIDLFIAATCLVYDLTLITFNSKHFSHVPNLHLYTTS